MVMMTKKKTAAAAGPTNEFSCGWVRVKTKKNNSNKMASDERMKRRVCVRNINGPGLSESLNSHLTHCVGVP